MREGFGELSGHESTELLIGTNGGEEWLVVLTSLFVDELIGDIRL